jgi:hypothetical protein
MFGSLIKLYFSYISRYVNAQALLLFGLASVRPTVHLLSNAGHSCQFLPQQGQMSPNEGGSDDRSKRETMQ